MPPPRRPAALSLAIAMCVLAFGLGGCSVFSFPYQVRGNKVDDAQIKELVPGTSTRADVTSLLGSPTARATFDDNTWIYIAEVTRPVIGGTQSVRDQQVVVLTFDDKGVLQGVNKKTQEDSLPVAVVSRATPSPGNDASVLQQLLGNVGRFNPGIPSGGPSGLSAGPSSP